MEKKENTPQRTARRKYEEVNKEKRKQEEVKANEEVKPNTKYNWTK